MAGPGLTLWPRATPSSPKDYGERHPWTPFPLFCSGPQDDNHGSSFSRIFNFSVSFFRIIFYLNLKNCSRRKLKVWYYHVTSSSSLPIHCQTWSSLPSCWPMHHRPLVTLSPSWPVFHWPQPPPRFSIPVLAGASLVATSPQIFHSQAGRCSAWPQFIPSLPEHFLCSWLAWMYECIVMKHDRMGNAQFGQSQIQILNKIKKKYCKWISRVL